jgi:polyisoprenoid-binding protein YceI
LEVKASGPKKFYIDNRAGNSQVTIFSQSTLEDFSTVCNKVSGQFTIDPKDLGRLAGHFAIRVEDMRTGIDLRDRDLRNADWLDSARYPEIAIDITAVENIKKTEPNQATLVMVGKCGLHGKTNPVRIPCTLTYLDESPITQKLTKGDLIRMRADFGVKLSDYAITGPAGTQTIGLKVSDEQAIKVSVFASTEPPPPPLTTDKEPDKAAPQVRPPERRP